MNTSSSKQIPSAARVVMQVEDGCILYACSNLPNIEFVLVDNDALREQGLDTSQREALFDRAARGCHEVEVITDLDLLSDVPTDPVYHPDDQISIVWHIDDVLEAMRDYHGREVVDQLAGIVFEGFAERLRKVLQSVKKNHDASLGVNWDTLRYAADAEFATELGVLGYV